MKSRLRNFVGLLLIIPLLLFTFTLTGCAGKIRNNSKTVTAGFIDPATGMPTWVTQTEDWQNEVKSTLSKSAVNGVDVTETRGGDGSVKYEAKVDNAGTSPELKNLEKLLDFAERVGQGIGQSRGFNIPAAQPQTVVTPDGQTFVLTRSEFQDLPLRGDLADTPSPGAGPNQPSDSSKITISVGQLRQLIQDAQASPRESETPPAAGPDPGRDAG